jgi:serine/threonine-protein kinase
MALVTCPRCSVAEISAETKVCTLCGYGAAEATGGAEAAPEAIDPIVEHELGRLFHLERLERRGPVSCVYVAREVSGGRVVALKVVPRPAQQVGAAAEAFRGSMAIAAALDHPHIVSVYRYGTTPHLFWYSMQRVAGGSLAETLAAVGRLELRPCLRVIEQVAGALHYAHCRGVTHGNVKPANVLVGPGEWVLLGDFALARPFAVGDAAGGGGPSSRLPGYVAPEERHARHPGPAVDQYALAMLVLECLQGAASQTTAADLPRLVDARLDVPAHVWGALARATSREPSARFPSVLDLVAALETGAPTPLPIGSVRTARTPPPALLWDEAYEPAVPPARGPRFGRRLGIGAAGVVVLAAVVASVAWWVERSPAAAEPEVVAPGPSRSLGVDSVVPPVGRPAPLAAGRAPDRVAPGPLLTIARPRRPPPPPPPRAPRPAPLAPGRLFVSATPWGELYLDDQPVGHTPRAKVSIAAGSHRVRIERDDFEPFEQTIEIRPGQDVRLTGVVLRALKP